MEMLVAMLLSIGEAIAEVRDIKGMTQDEVCRKVGTSINFLSQVENGRKGISHAMVERLADAFEIPVSFLYLLADRGNNPLVSDLQETVRMSLKSGKSCL